MTTHFILIYLLLLTSIYGYKTLRYNGITVNLDTEECEFGKFNQNVEWFMRVYIAEILYLDIQFFCHTKERPSFFIGKGNFDAVYYVGNYDLNDTIDEKVMYI